MLRQLLTQAGYIPGEPIPDYQVFVALTTRGNRLRRALSAAQVTSCVLQTNPEAKLKFHSRCAMLRSEGLNVRPCIVRGCLARTKNVSSPCAPQVPCGTLLSNMSVSVEAMVQQLASAHDGASIRENLH